MESTIETVLSSVICKDLLTSEIEAAPSISRKRIGAARIKRDEFENAVAKTIMEEKTEESESESELCISSDNSEIENYRAYYNTSDEVDDLSSLDSTAEMVEENSMVQSEKKCEKKYFFSSLTPRRRKTRKDKLDLNVVRDFCHNICRLDTFASA